MAPARLGLPRDRRLLRPSEFEAAARGEYKLRDRYFGIRARKRGAPHPRLGVSVSRRVSAKAVARNRIKRQIRDSFRLNQGILGGVDVVVVAYGAADQASSAELRASLCQHWEKIARLCRPSS